MSSVQDGGESWKVGERAGVRNTVLCVEIEAYPEPKILLPQGLANIVGKEGGIQKAANRIGASYVFVWQNKR